MGKITPPPQRVKRIASRRLVSAGGALASGSTVTGPEGSLPPGGGASPLPLTQLTKSRDLLAAASTGLNTPRLCRPPRPQFNRGVCRVRGSTVNKESSGVGKNVRILFVVDSDLTDSTRHPIFRHPIFRFSDHTSSHRLVRLHKYTRVCLTICARPWNHASATPGPFL